MNKLQRRDFATGLRSSVWSCCFRMRHLVDFEISSLPQRLNTSRLVRRILLNTNRVRLETTLNLASSALERTAEDSTNSYFNGLFHISNVVYDFSNFRNDGRLFHLTLSHVFWPITTLLLGTCLII